MRTGGAGRSAERVSQPPSPCAPRTVRWFGRGSLQEDELYLWREWRIQGTALRSVYVDYEWPVVPEAARCHRTDRDHRPVTHFCGDSFLEKRLECAPTKYCECGYYGRYYYADLLQNAFVHGIISVWGKVERHKFGARAQFARPEIVCLSDRWAQQEETKLDALRWVRHMIAERYGCPVFIGQELTLDDIVRVRPDLYSFVRDTGE